MQTPVRIQIVSDFVCPWCYVGKRRLETALASRPGISARISWLPFELSPDMPREGRDRQAHYAEIFGAERAGTIIGKMVETAAADGLVFATAPGARAPNTLAAHRLLYWAGQIPEVDQNALAEQLFAAHHTRSEDIGDPAVLARLAAGVGMTSPDLEARLRSDADEAVVRGLIDEARRAGVSGVPFLIFDQQQAVSGAQPPEVFGEILDQLVAGRGRTG
ncbi:MAG: DsbA family oxidoreductase [Gammaproteobacteria bacterium]|nr:DsbA family oxidoreductase [Gammaproteobacteria bacterium]